ncbi:MAG: RNA polymerase sigma factor [Hyphomonadaceae bacterium]|nr:RNA polymerase sigma factor [Hyphomonadaceae bacterium]
MSAILSEFAASKAALQRYLRRFFSAPQDVEDVLQEVFLRAYAAEARGPILLARAYLFRVAKHVALNELARKRNFATSSMEDFDDPDVVGSETQTGVEQEVDGRRRLALFASAVASLPDQCRKVLVLKKIEGLSQREIAKRLGIAESTVEKHLAKGLLLSRDFMTRREGGDDGSASTSNKTGVRRLRLGEGE